MTWLSLALALVQAINFVFGKLDAAAKEKAVRALVEQENLQKALDENNRARAARDDVERRRAADPNWLPSNDPNRLD